MSNLIIGIVGKTLGDNDFGVTLPYMEYFSQWGTSVVISPHSMITTKKLFNFVDVFVLPGGEDINSSRYGEYPGFFTGKPSIQLEYFDERILPHVINCRKPIIGICRGIQSINVFFGGTLVQNLLYHKRSWNSREELVHKIKMNDGKIFQVNSLHHQGIKALGRGLVDLGKSEDGIIEVIRHEELPIFGVQWHPEEIYDSFTIGYINSMLGI